jgi:hypothetical protein
MTLEIACDESGYEGERLIGSTTDVFAHASVRLGTPVAAAFMDELRDRIRSPATEYKANHVLREKHRRVLEWLLGPDAPLRGNARVFLIDKAFYVFGKLLGRTAVESPYRRARQALGPREWPRFLARANDLMRDNDSGFRTELDPLVPAIVRAVAHWGRAGPVQVIHDRQNTLTPRRIDHLKELCGDRLSGLTLGDSTMDARIQVADIIAGVARKIVSDGLNGRGDPELTALVEGFVDTESVLPLLPKVASGTVAMK